MIDNLDQTHRNGCAGEVERRVENNPRRPRPVDRLPPEQRPRDFGRDDLDETVRDEGGCKGNALHRPCEMTERAAERHVRESRGLRRSRDRHEVHESPAVLMFARMGNASRDRAGDRHHQRRMGAEDQQRCELDDE